MIPALLLVLLLFGPAAAAAQTFTRGQWTQWGSGTYNSAVWRSTGTATIRDGSTIPNGTQLGSFIGRRGSSESGFDAWVTSVWDTTRNQMMICCGTGDQAWTTNEVNVFDLATGTWNPDGRPMDPTTQLFEKTGITWPVGTFVGDNRAPVALIDNLGVYPTNALLDPAGSQRLYPNGRQHYGGFVYMPTVQRFFMWGGFGWWLSGSGSSYPWEWDPVAKKWQAQTLDIPRGENIPMPSCAWDSTNSRVLCFTSNSKLYAYTPGNAQGSRMAGVSPNLSDVLSYSNSTINYAQLAYDSRRKHAVMFGGQLGCVLFDMANPRAGKISACTMRGDTGWIGQNGPGVLYDPVADLFVAWLGGKTLYKIDPGTFVSTAFTPGSGVTPTMPTLSSSTGGVWNRFAYIPAYDVYATIGHAGDAGAYIFAPVRTTVSAAPGRLPELAPTEPR